MSKLLDDLRAKAAASAGPATAMQTQATVATKTETQAEEQTASIEITEAQIKQNPFHQIWTNTQESEETRVKKLIELKAYNKEKTKEENAVNLKAYNEFLLHVENELLTTTKKAKEFTNDDAFSFFDNAVQTLKHDIESFKGQIVPLTKALGVLQKAASDGVKAGEILDGVKSMQDARAKVRSDLEAKQAELQKAKENRTPIESEATAQADHLIKLEEDIQKSKGAKAAAEGIREAENAKWLIQRNRQALRDAEATIQDEEQKRVSAESSKSILELAAQATIQKLERSNDIVTKCDAEIHALEAKAAELDQELTADEDTAAVAQLLEIAGANYKDNRKGLSATVDRMLDNSISSFDKSMSRFRSGREEVTGIRNTVVNIDDMLALCGKADAKVRVMDADYISGQEAIVKRIKEQKGPDAVYDPEYVTAKEQLDQASAHSKEGLILASRTGELDSKLTLQQGSYTGLIDALRQKEMDAQRLRTNAAVETSSKLLLTTKSVEMMMAGESASQVDGMLDDLSATTDETIKNLWNSLARGEGADNARQQEAVKRAMETAAAISGITEERKQKAKEGIATQEALRQINEGLGSLNEGLDTVRTAAEREVQQEGLQQAGEAAARRIGGIPAAPSQP
jgi:hypothetical protein